MRAGAPRPFCGRPGTIVMPAGAAFTRTVCAQTGPPERAAIVRARKEAIVRRERLIPLL